MLYYEKHCFIRRYKYGFIRILKKMQVLYDLSGNLQAKLFSSKIYVWIIKCEMLGSHNDTFLL